MVLSSLQRTVMSAALNKPTKPDFHSHGVPNNSLVDQFSLKTALASYSNFSTQPAMCSDGKYLYLLVSSNLLKIGTGFNGTYKGHVYAMNSDFGKDKCGWLGYSGVSTCVLFAYIVFYAFCFYFRENYTLKDYPNEAVNQY